MRRLHVGGAVCLAFWMLGWEAVSKAQAAQPADAVPDSASLVLRWKSPRASLERLAEFADAAVPGLGFGERINREWLSLLVGTISGGELPDMTGVDASQDFWIILTAESGREMPLVFMVTAKDVEAVKTALDDQFATHAVGNLVVFSEDEEAVDKVRDQLQRKQSTFWSGVDAASKRLFDASDVSVIVNVRRLTDEFADIVTWAETSINTFQVSNSPSESDKGQLNQLDEGQLAALQSYMSATEDLYRDIGRDVIRGIRDSKCLVLGVSFSKTAIRCETALQVEMETPTASAFAKQTTSELSLMSRLPANQAVYYGVCGDSAGYMDWSREFTRKMLKRSSNEESSKLNAALKETGSVKFEEMAGYLDIAASEPAFRMGTVSMMTPTKPMRELSHLFYKAMSKLPTPFSSMKLESGVDKIGGVEVDRTTVKLESDTAADPTDLMPNYLKVLYGEKGLETLEMHQTNRLLQVTGGGKPGLQSLIAALDAPPAKGSPVADARPRLAEKANVVVLIDLARLILSGAPRAAREGILPIDAGALDALTTDASFIGFSLICEPVGIRSQLDIPVAQAQNIAKVILPLVTAAKK